MFKFYFNINHGEPTNCLIIEVDTTNPKLEGMVKVLLDNSDEVWVREDSIKPII